jgi:hypothetical protein
MTQTAAHTPSTQEYREFRDGLYEPRYLTEPHMHHAFYSDEGELERKCARCHRDLIDPLHMEAE